jgi:hypothetical protein
VQRMKGRHTGGPGGGRVTAVVVTHRRPRLAGDLVRALLDVEGFSPAEVIVVVSGQGGLDDLDLEASVRMVRLAENVGPGGGFRTGLFEAFKDPATEWAYLCEDDVGLFGLPSPRVERLLSLVTTDSGRSSIGAVVAYGRRFLARGHTVNVVPDTAAPPLVEVDVAAWGATLVARAVVDRGVLPAADWFFGFEDFDFFCRVRRAGLSVLVDSAAARAVEQHQTTSGRDAAVGEARPTDAEEPWRAYYVARNFFHLSRAHGSTSWLTWHLVYSARRLQLATSIAERKATLHGLLDGARGRLGPHPAHQRTAGERDEIPS